MATKRRERDAYLTPAWMVHSLLHHVPELGGRILEPCVGDGAISRVLADSGRAQLIYTNDIDPAVTADSHFDAAAAPFWERFNGTLAHPQWVCTNSPWAMPKGGVQLPVEILQRAYATATRGVALLLRITFLEPCENRGAWLADHPPSRVIVLPRYSFTGDGKSDSATAAWFVWGKFGLTGPAIVIDHEAESRTGKAAA